MKFLPVIAEEILIQNILAKYDSWLNVLRRHNVRGTSLLVLTGAVNCCPAPMVKNLVLWWHTFEVLQLQPQKNVQSDHVYVSVGIVGLSHVRASQCTSTLSLQNGCIFGARVSWFHVPMLLSTDMINILH